MMLTARLSDIFNRSAADTLEDSPLLTVLGALPPLSSSGPWLGGGALRRTLIGDPLDSDFDFFFASQEQMDGWVAALPQPADLVRESAHHKHYRMHIAGRDVDAQAIHFRFYGSASEVADSFDYTICQFVFDGVTLTYGDYSLWDLGRRKLAVHKITYPVASMRRALKYGRQGYTVCDGAMATLLRQTVSTPEIMANLSVEYID